ncbi:hypothetical protein C2845_PM04G03620 [Panicum miliaceum]|uniref:Uncharacterized protein n=1 Tax=Panicum miliaceum TaxID=4540 RepID=A0A3L6QQF1_PANMI|nr:hypothetical protein C2845_PM04G03620 [Panicum miliaceum]
MGRTAQKSAHWLAYPSLPHSATLCLSPSNPHSTRTLPTSHQRAAVAGGYGHQAGRRQRRTGGSALALRGEGRRLPGAGGSRSRGEPHGDESGPARWPAATRHHSRQGARVHRPGQLLR